MKRNISKLLILLGLLLVSTGAMAQRQFTMNLWQGKAPHNTGVATDTAKVFVYLPAQKKATGRCVVICPGGSYINLAIDHEGRSWAPFFNQMGIAAVVLKYRMPHGEYEAPISDAEEAIKLVRRNARNWNIDVNDVGIMGFSAGGHLASTIATHSRGQAAPNFQILFYPVISMMQDCTHQGSHDNFLGKHASKKKEREYSSDMQVSRMTPRAWIGLSEDDDVVMPANGLNYYTQLYRHDVRASIHIYPSGGHGYGFNPSFAFHIPMLLDLKYWLESF